MARSKLQVRGAEGPRPFMRGILVRSLVARGVPFEVALETATRVREQLGARGSVDASELVALVEQLLPEYELEIPADGAAPRLLRVRAGHGSTPFSKGLLAVSLEGAGIDRGEAWDVALQVESRVRRLPGGEIERSALRRLVAETLQLRHGERVAERYSIWRETREAGKPLLLLIGGSTGVGKTSVAIEVARRLEIARVIGTDSIRQIMRLMFSPELMPEIYGSTFDAYLERGDVAGVDPAIAAFRGQAQKIAVGVRALLDRAAEESTSMLIEGANLLPSALDLERYRESAHVVFVIVGTLDPEAYRDRFHSRAAREHNRDAARYLAHMREILGIQQHLLAEAESLGLPVIDNEQFDETVLAVIRTVLATLKKSMGSAVGTGS